MTETELERLARAATPGPWCVENPLEPDLAIVEPGKEAYEWAGRFIAHVPHYEKGEWEPGHFSTAQIQANAAYIAAASPDRVLALISRIRELEEGLREILCCHDGNQAPEMNMPDLDYARRTISAMHRIARALLPESNS